MTTRLWIMAAVAVAALATGCSSSGSGSSGSGGGSGGGSSSQPAGGSGPVTITATHGRLTAADGKTLYYNTVDTAQHINCTGSCASLWPPVVGTAHVGSGLNKSAFSTAARPDGTQQVTFHGHPLYEFGADGPGDTKGKGLSDAGGRWVVATPQPAAGGASSAPANSGGYGGGY